MTARPEPTLGADERELVNAPLAGIDRDEGMDRTYIPLPGGWEVQTQGKGSSFRLCDTKSGQRWIITDKMAHKAIEQMARDVHAAALAAPAVAVSAEPVEWRNWIVTALAELDAFDLPDDNNHLAAAVSALRHALATPVGPDEVDEVDARDAARYRWLRDHSDPDGEVTGLACSEGDFNDWGNHFTRYFRGGALDAKVDAALASTKPSKGAS